jgi:hypothetical protein
MIGRALVVHFALLGVAAGAAIFVWTRDKKAAVVVTNVTVWNGRAADVERVGFESKTKSVSLESRKDAQGRWFFGTQTTPATDAGAPKTVTFASVGSGEKLAEALAPLKGLREVGKIGDDRAAEFGVKEPDGTLTVRLAGKERKLAFGARTVGGGDRYVRDEATGIVYVVKGDVTRDIETGEGSLAERDWHAFKDADIESLKVLAHGKTREVLHRGSDQNRIWSDPSDPDKPDETASNWISKVERLRPNEYLDPQPSAAEPILRIEYRARGAQGAFLEIAKLPASPKPDFIVKTERTRLWTKVNATMGEQVEQDLGSVVK